MAEAGGGKKEQHGAWEPVFYFLFLKRASPPVLDRPITADLNPTRIQTGGDGVYQPAVICLFVVVLPNPAPEK
jgi:hypothetical protein